MKKSTSKVYFWGGVSVVLFTLLIVVQLLFMGWRAVSTRQMIAQHDQSLVISLAVDEFRTATHDLSRYALVYVQTQRQAFYDDYETIRRWRVGRAPRPNYLSPHLAPAGCLLAQRELILRLHIPAPYHATWENIFRLADELRALEQQAMESVKLHKIVEGPAASLTGESPTAFARRVLQEAQEDIAYADKLQACLASLDNFMAIYTEATRRDNEALLWRFTFITLASLLWQIVAALGLGCTVFLFWRGYRHGADERLRLMFDSAPMSCSLINSQDQIIDCNLATLKLYQLASVEEFRRRAGDLLPPQQSDGTESRAEAMKKLQAAFKFGFQQFDWTYQTLAGEARPVEVTLVRVPYEKQFVIAAYARDLRSRQALQRALNQERLLLLDILNSSPICLAIVVRGQMKFVTPFMTEFLGATLEDNLVDFFADRAVGEKILYKALCPESPAEPEAPTPAEECQWYAVTMQAKRRGARRGDTNGDQKEMLVHACATEYYGERGVMIWFTDVTKMMQVEAELRVARDAAEQSAISKGEFLANMSHEIRTPMNAIHGMTYLCLQTELTEEQRSYLHKAQTATAHLLGIINDILDFSKIEAGKLYLEKIDFRLSDVVEGVLDVIEYQANMKGIKFCLDVAESVHNHLLGDPLRLRQILLNLTNNAIKFTEFGGVTLSITQVPTTVKNAYVSEHTAEQTTLRFMVRDSGIGMTQEQVDNLFIAFTQADGSTTRRYGGTGLGLTISKNLVERMGGTLHVESVQKRGTTFSFAIPFGKTHIEEKAAAEIDAAAHQSLPPTISLERRFSLAGARVLLAEDNKVNQIVTTELLKLSGLAVDIANDGSEAVQKVRDSNYNYDLILMDIQMPHQDGLSATQEIRAMDKEGVKEIPILAMTAHAMSGDREKSLAAGMNDHITKPIDPAEFRSALERWLIK